MKWLGDGAIQVALYQRAAWEDGWSKPPKRVAVRLADDPEGGMFQYQTDIWDNLMGMLKNHMLPLAIEFTRDQPAAVRWHHAMGRMQVTREEWEAFAQAAREGKFDVDKLEAADAD